MCISMWPIILMYVIWFHSMGDWIKTMQTSSNSRRYAITSVGGRVPSSGWKVQCFSYATLTILHYTRISDFLKKTEPWQAWHYRNISLLAHSSYTSNRHVRELQLYCTLTTYWIKCSWNWNDLNRSKITRTFSGHMSLSFYGTANGAFNGNIFFKARINSTCLLLHRAPERAPVCRSHSSHTFLSDSLVYSLPSLLIDVFTDVGKTAERSRWPKSQFHALTRCSWTIDCPTDREIRGSYRGNSNRWCRRTGSDRLLCFCRRDCVRHQVELWCRGRAPRRSTPSVHPASHID